MQSEKKVIIMTVENKSGVLNRVTSLLRRRNFNIDSLTVARTNNPLLSRMTITLEETINTEQVTKQLHKLVNVLKVCEFSESNIFLHESIFIKVNIGRSKREEILKFGEMFSAKIIEVCDKTITFEYSSTSAKVESFIEFLRPFGIKEMVRSGAMAIAKDQK